MSTFRHYLFPPLFLVGSIRNVAALQGCSVPLRQVRSRFICGLAKIQHVSVRLLRRSHILVTPKELTHRIAEECSRGFYALFLESRRGWCRVGEKCRLLESGVTRPETN